MLGVSRGSCPKKFWEKKLRVQLNSFAKSVQNLERKKRKKKEKTHRGQKWVGWDERVC